MILFLFYVLVRNASFLAVTFIPTWKITPALPFPAEHLWWVILLVHCHSHQTPLLLRCRTFLERTGSTGGTLPGMLLAVAMKPGEGLIAKQTIEK